MPVGVKAVPGGDVRVRDGKLGAEMLEEGAACRGRRFGLKSAVAVQLSRKRIVSFMLKLD